MHPEQWTEMDRYFSENLVPVDPVLEAALTASQEGGLPSINVAPNQGKMLQVLARLVGARRILEVGTLGGYSTIWLARALPAGGQLITLELEPKHAAVAQANFVRAGVDDRIEVRVGPASAGLAGLIAEGVAPFDFIFLDADKAGTPGYFDQALQLSHPGTAIVVDNVLRHGDVIDAASEDAGVRGMRTFLDRAARDPRVDGTAVQTVGVKGYDGFALLIVNG